MPPHPIAEDVIVIFDYLNSLREVCNAAPAGVVHRAITAEQAVIFIFTSEFRKFPFGDTETVNSVNQFSDISDIKVSRSVAIVPLSTIVFPEEVKA